MENITIHNREKQKYLRLDDFRITIEMYDRRLTIKLKIGN